MNAFVSSRGAKSHLLVGAYDDELANNAGAAYVYRDGFGSSVASLGDLDRDGTEDLDALPEP